ncbi:MAG TPA: SMP-30/gluconolactonase/LRE family protein [Humisphaera sp.]
MPTRRSFLLAGSASLLLPSLRGFAGSAAAAPATAPTTAPSPIAGIFKAEPVPGSEVLGASGLCWWDGRLIVADRENKRLITHTPPDKFGVLKEVTHPVGVAVDPPTGDLILTEKPKDGVPRVARLTKDGKDVTLASGPAVGTPHFVAVHSNGTIFWSGFPDGGTRSLKPGGEVVVHTPRIGHTYGIALSPDERWLYVASKLPNPDRRGVWRFPLDKDAKAAEAEFFLQVQALSPDVPNLPPPNDGKPGLLGWVGRIQGIAVDALGYLYVAGAESHNSGEAVAVVTPDGKKVIAMILGVPRNISGLAFGGADGRTLYITGAGNYRLHQVRLPVPGAGLGRVGGG